MKHFSILIFSIPLAMLGCTTTSDSATGSGAGGAGGAGAGPPTEVVCPPDYEVLVVPAVLEDVSGLCLVTNEQLDLSVCVNDSSDGFVLRCQKRLADDAEFWFAPGYQLSSAEGFGPCDSSTPPPSCEFDQCEESGGFLAEEPISLCTAEDTTAAFDCGGDTSVYDDNCCARPFCDEVPCATGFTCRTVGYRAKRAAPFFDDSSQETDDCLVYEDLESAPLDVEVCFPD